MLKLTAAVAAILFATSADAAKLYHMSVIEFKLRESTLSPIDNAFMIGALRTLSGYRGCFDDESRPAIDEYVDQRLEAFRADPDLNEARTQGRDWSDEKIFNLTEQFHAENMKRPILDIERVYYDAMYGGGNLDHDALEQIRDPEKVAFDVEAACTVLRDRFPTVFD